MSPETPHPVAPGGALRRGFVAVLMLALALPASLVYARIHTVGEGETLSTIAEEYGVSLEVLASANGIDNPDLIYLGQELNVGDGGPAVGPPAARMHIVMAGDSLSAIAAHYGLTLDDLLDLNHITDANYIYEGQTISLPGASSPPAPLSRFETEAILRAAAYEFGVDPSLVLGLAWLESGWNQSMTSQVGAVGIMQLMPHTAEWGLEYLAPDAVNWRTSTTDNVRLGTAIFGHLLVQAGWDVELALAFYYQGWRSIEVNGMYEDTYQYIDNVLALAAEFR